MNVGDRVQVPDPTDGHLMSGVIERIRPPNWYHKAERTIVVRIDPEEHWPRPLGWWRPDDVVVL